MKVRLAVLLWCGLAMTTAHAQLAVIDPSNLAQVVLIAQRAQRQYDELAAERQTLVRMAQGLGRLDRYRIPAVEGVLHDSSRSRYASRWLAALNAGDPAGAAYRASVVAMQAPSSLPAGATGEALKAFERGYGAVEIADAVASAAGHQVGTVRQYAARLQRAVDAMDADVVNPDARFHQMTAILDKVTVGELLARRQDMAANQLLSHAVEQLLARANRQRNADAVALNMQLLTWRDAPAVNQAFVAGAGDALRTWRQP